MKDELRRLCLEARKKNGNRTYASRRISERLSGMDEMKHAKTIYFYVNLPTEVSTQELIKRLLKTKKVVVPYVRDGKLGLFDLKAMDELEPGAHNILEPKKNLRIKEREVSPQEIDLFIIPGLAFDAAGNRLGFGGGYHDKMLAKARTDAVKIGLAFECQIVDEISATPTDIPVDYVITEKKTIKC